MMYIRVRKAYTHVMKTIIAKSGKNIVKGKVACVFVLEHIISPYNYDMVGAANHRCSFLLVLWGVNRQDMCDSTMHVCPHLLNTCPGIYRNREDRVESL